MLALCTSIWTIRARYSPSVLDAVALTEQNNAQDDRQDEAQDDAPNDALAKHLVLPVGQAHHHDSSDVTSAGIARKEVQVPWMLLPVCASMVCGLIIFIYGPDGTAVVTSVLTYVFALSTMKLAVKLVFQTFAYPFPKFVTFLHFVSGAIVTYAIMKQRDLPIPRPTVSEFSLVICPIAFSVALSIGANNMALIHSSAAFTEIIGATNCLITIALIIFMGMPFNTRLIPAACVVALGCALGTVGEISFSLLGTILCLASNVFRSLKVVLQQKLMTGESKDKFDPVALLFWISLPSMAVMLIGSLLTEGFAPYTAVLGRGSSAEHGLLFAILVSCVNATILNLAQLFVTKHLSAVGSQLVAQAKMVLTVLGGLVLFGEAFSRLEVVGFLVSTVGVYNFSRMDQALKEEQKAKQIPSESTALDPIPFPKEKTYQASGKSA